MGSADPAAHRAQPLCLAAGKTQELGTLGGGVIDYKDQPSGCQFLLSDDNTVIQVRETGTYNRIDQSTSLLRPATFAGVPGRIYAFSDSDQICSAELASRSIGVPSVDVFRKNKQGDRQQHCDLAQKAMEMIAKRYVPLAGGTPSSSARQGLPSSVLQAATACDLANAGTAYLGLDSGTGTKGTTPQGSTCTLTGGSTTATALLTTGAPGLDEVPIVPGASVTTTKLGSFPLRIEQEPAKCTLSLEYTGGQVFQLAVGPKDAKPTTITCQAGRVALASVLYGQYEQASFQ